MLSQLLSNRVEKTPATEVSADRYQFLALSEAEPDLGVPSSNGYILSSTTSGMRSWVDPTTNLAAPGSDTQVVFNNSGVLAGATGLVYDVTTGRVGIGNTPLQALDVAGNVFLRNNTTPTNLYIHNTYTDASNYERGFARWNSNSFEIGTTYLGTGTRRALKLGNGGTDGGQTIIYSGNYSGSNITITPSGTARIVIDYTNIRPYSDNTYPLGQSDRRFQSLYVNAGVYNGDTLQKTESSTVATATQTQIASFAVASFRSGKIVVQAYDSETGEVQVSELLVAHNGTTASATEYGVVYTGAGPIVSYDVDITGGNVRLLATRTTANSTQYKVSETLMVA